MKLVFIRHGQSQLNRANVFTGWLDPKLSDQGVEEAQQAGLSLKETGIHFDRVHTSVLTLSLIHI